jgi:recombination protein RecR
VHTEVPFHLPEDIHPFAVPLALQAGMNPGDLLREPSNVRPFLEEQGISLEQVEMAVMLEASPVDMLAILRKDCMDEGQQLADALMTAMLDIKQCKRCRGLSDDDICPVCTDPRRNDSVLCIVETAADMMAIEQTANFNGKYFVLGGHLSPIDGIGAEQLGIGQLLRLLQQQAQDGEPIQEIILATSTTVEGQTTAHFISEAVKPYVSMITRIAQGIPMGGELEYLDAMTLGQALQNRGRL